jgi:hypothetical protein
MGKIRRLLQAPMRTSVLLASTSVHDSIRRGVRYGIAFASALALLAYGILLPLLIAGAALAFYRGDSFDKVAMIVGTVVSKLALLYPLMCAMLIAYGVAAAEYARRLLRRRL